MSRMPRVFLPGLPCHVTVRGNDRRDIVLAESDRQRFLADLQGEASRNGLAVHAYVLMTNHIHLLVTPRDEVSLSRSIQGLGRRYVAYFNPRYGRTGTLWEGRYKASPVTNDRYLLACHRYIDLNPVRVGMAVDPGEYRWSSHRHYTRGDADPLVTPHEYWLSLGSSDAERRAAYLALFEEPLTGADLAAIRKASHEGTALGDSVSCKRLELRLGIRVTPGARGRPKKKMV